MGFKFKTGLAAVVLMSAALAAGNAQAMPMGAAGSYAVKPEASKMLAETAGWRRRGYSRWKRYRRGRHCHYVRDCRGYRGGCRIWLRRCHRHHG